MDSGEWLPNNYILGLNSVPESGAKVCEGCHKWLFSEGAKWDVLGDMSDINKWHPYRVCALWDPVAFKKLLQKIT